MGIGTRKRTYLVDVHFDVAKTVEIDAESPKAAQDAVAYQISLGDIGYRDPGFEATDDVSVDCVGMLKKDKDGNWHREYFG